MELWSSTVSDHSNLIYTPISIRDVDRKKATSEPSSSPIQHRAQHGHFQDSQGITQKTTYYIYFHRGHRIGDLDNLSLSRKCMETFVRTATIDQPAAEPDSYWVRFPGQLHLEKDQIHDQTKVFTFSF